VRCMLNGGRVPGRSGLHVLTGPWPEASLIKPMPAHSRTASIPATAADLSAKPDDTAITIPLASRSRNLNRDCSSTNNSKRPAMSVLPLNAGKTPPDSPVQGLRNRLLLDGTRTNRTRRCVGNDPSKKCGDRRHH
jgi:hypothetical protein